MKFNLIFKLEAAHGSRKIQDQLAEFWLWSLCQLLGLTSGNSLAHTEYLFFFFLINDSWHLDIVISDLIILVVFFQKKCYKELYNLNTLSKLEFLLLSLQASILKEHSIKIRCRKTKKILSWLLNHKTKLILLTLSYIFNFGKFRRKMCCGILIML